MPPSALSAPCFPAALACTPGAASSQAYRHGSLCNHLFSLSSPKRENEASPEEDGGGSQGHHFQGWWMGWTALQGPLLPHSHPCSKLLSTAPPRNLFSEPLPGTSFVSQMVCPRISGAQLTSLFESWYLSLPVPARVQVGVRVSCGRIGRGPLPPILKQSMGGRVGEFWNSSPHCAALSYSHAHCR